MNLSKPSRAACGSVAISSPFSVLTRSLSRSRVGHEVIRLTPSFGGTGALGIRARPFGPSRPATPVQAGSLLLMVRVELLARCRILLDRCVRLLHGPEVFFTAPLIVAGIL